MIVGIDPGKYGGLAFMRKGGDCKVYEMPLVDSKVDVGRLQEIFLESYQMFLSSIMKSPIIVYLEKQQLRSGNRGNMVIGENYGRITATLDLLDLNTKEVSPSQWKKHLFPGEKTKGDKEISIRKCLELGYELPTLKPKGKKLHDGIADAICIALYGWDQEDE